MNTKQHTREVLKIAGLVVVLASLPFAITALAQAAGTEGTADSYSSAAQQDAPEADISSAGEASDPSVAGSQGKSWWQKRQASRKTRVEAYHQRKAARIPAPPQGPTALAGPLDSITVAFKLDPRLTRSLYMGDRWVSPPTYTQLQDGASLIVAVMAHGRDAKGQAVAIRPEWIVADPEVATVTPGAGGVAQITVRRAGETTLRVTSQGVSKTLFINASQQPVKWQGSVAVTDAATDELISRRVYEQSVMKVEISQQPART